MTAANMTAPRRTAYAHDLPGSRVDPDDECWPATYTALGAHEAHARLNDVGDAHTIALHGGKARADCVSFQPCAWARSQDRAVIRELDIHGSKWIFAGVFDGHLGEDTVAHTGHYLPLIVEEQLRAAHAAQKGQSVGVDVVADVLRRSIRSFDEAIAQDVLDLFPGGLDGLWRLPNDYVCRVINDGGENFKKTKLCMYGTTALVALVDPTRENLWTANLGDCQGVLVNADQKEAAADVLTRVHNGTCSAEIARVVREHPGEAECVSDGRVLGVMAPFRCIGDIPFKLPPIFTRKILYNLHPGFHNSSPWEHFLSLNRSPPYVSSDAEVAHRRLHGRQRLVLCTDGLADISHQDDPVQAAKEWGWIIKEAGSSVKALDRAKQGSNMAADLLYQVLGGEDVDSVARALTLELEEPWFDDVTIIVLSL